MSLWHATLRNTPGNNGGAPRSLPQSHTGKLRVYLSNQRSSHENAQVGNTPDMQRIQLSFTGPLDDYAELLRELHNHNVRVEPFRQVFGAEGKTVTATLNTDHSHFIENVARKFASRPDVELRIERGG